ncbi:hypothetical protein ACPUER_35855 [Burkholderia sp. DN3021]|uniref:hypothetical protein n=1 Tax=Burkholderia sp. DN3021 TaxID=3410137 RepID=UPI003C7EC12D
MKKVAHMLPIVGSHSIVSAQSTDSAPSRNPDITTHVNVLLNGSAKNFHVSTWGNRAAEDHLFSESGVMLRQPWIDATDFERRVAQLPQAERLALRQWTSTEDESGRYSDNTKVISGGMNYELNAKLASGEPLSTEESNMVVNMDRALIDLPTLPGEFLRVVEHSRDCPPPWGSIIQVDDVVSNFPCFMSASTTADC